MFQEEERKADEKKYTTTDMKIAVCVTLLIYTYILGFALGIEKTVVCQIVHNDTIVWGQYLNNGTVNYGCIEKEREYTYDKMFVHFLNHMKTCLPFSLFFENGE
jgi:hypothetical protein